MQSEVGCNHGWGTWEYERPTVYLGVELLGHKVCIWLTSGERAGISTMLLCTDVHNYHSVSCSSFLLIVDCIVRLFNFCHSSQCVVVSHCSFNLRFLLQVMSKHLSMCLSAIWMYSCEVLFHEICLFPNGLSYWLGGMESHFDWGSLSDVHPVACLFLLLTIFWETPVVNSRGVLKLVVFLQW